MRQKGAVLLIIIATLLGVFVVISSLKKTSTSIPTKVSKPPTISKIPDNNCTKKSLEATSSFEGAAGTVYGTFTIKNISDQECAFPQSNYLAANFDKTLIKNLNPVHTGHPEFQVYILKPQEALSTTITYPNGPQCGGAVKQIPVTFSFNLSPQGEVIFPNVDEKAETMINICEDSSVQTEVKIAPFSTH
ncbi:MAG: hypothetical protein ABIO02_05000 [Patescibacteria group bacterium]